MEGHNYYFHKERSTDKVWWVDELDENGQPLLGRLLVSFDKKEVFNLWTDYQNLTVEQKTLFDKENPYWAEFFKK